MLLSMSRQRIGSPVGMISLGAGSRGRIVKRRVSRLEKNQRWSKTTKTTKKRKKTCKQQVHPCGSLEARSEKTGGRRKPKDTGLQGV